MNTLYDYFRSSASYRVRIALGYKGLKAKLKEVHLVNNGGEQYQDSYTQINPQARVPTWEEEDFSLTQSMAILEYLEESHPKPALLPADPKARAKVRALANVIACDVHPLNNLSVLQYLKNNLSVSDTQKQDWYAHWIQVGFRAFEAQIRPTAKQFCYGDQLTLADVCLIPQVYNAKRFNVDYTDCPTIERVYQHAMSLPYFIDAQP